MSDLKTMKQSPPEGVSASPMSEDNLFVWGGTVFGPDDTAWEGGIYSMRLTFTDQYPDKPPRVRFTSEMVRGSVPARAVRSAAAERGRRVPGRPSRPGPTSFHLTATTTSPSAVPSKHLPRRHALHGPDPGQLVPDLLGLLDPHRDPFAADGPQLREPGQPRGGAPLPDGQKAVWPVRSVPLPTTVPTHHAAPLVRPSAAE